MPIDPNPGLEVEPAPTDPDVPANPNPGPPDGPAVDPVVDPAPPATGKVRVGDVLAKKKADIDAVEKAKAEAAKANEALDGAVKADEASNHLTAKILEQSKDGVLLPDGSGGFELWQDAGNAAGFVVTHPDNADKMVDAPAAE